MLQVRRVAHYVPENPGGRKETDLPLFILETIPEGRKSGNGQMICKATPKPLRDTIERHLHNRRYFPDTDLRFLYKHGESPDTVNITVGEFLGWIREVESEIDNGRHISSKSVKA